MTLRLAVVLAVLGHAFAQDSAARLLAESHAETAAGRYPSAIAKGSQAVQSFRKTGDRNGEGRALTETGLARLYSGDYNAALDDFTNALNLARQINDRSAEVTRLNNIGTVLYFQGRYADSMERYETALAIVSAPPHEPWTDSRRQLTIGNIAMLYQTLGNYQRALDLYSRLLEARQALPQQEQAQLLSNVGALRRRLGDPVKALDTYRAAQDLYTRSAHRDGEIAVLNNIGIVQAMDLRDYPSAVATFTSSLSLAEASGDRPLAVHAHLYRGETLFRAGNVQASAADFEIAARDAEVLGEVEETWKALYGLARVAVARGDEALARRRLGRAVDLIESLRAGLGTSSLRSDFLADKRDVYDLLIERATSPADVFRFMEQSRARTLQDRLASAGRTDIRKFARGLHSDTAVLEYWMGPSSGAVLWITASQSGIERWKLSSEDRERIDALPAILSDTQRKDWRDAAAILGKQLLSAPPLRDTAIQHLVVIPDGPLGRLPFEALPLPAGRLLIERFTVAYSPSARLFATGGSRRAVRWPWQKMVEAYADPVPGAGSAGDDLILARAWSPLPQAAWEVDGIAKLLGGPAGLHIGRDARKEFLARAAGAPVLHFATHAFADPQDPDRSYVLLAPASSSRRFDYLFLKEVPSLSLAAVDLATLSACETEAGKFVRGEGVQSFSRAFLAAGAKSVLTSLWSVGDRSAAELMLGFYSGISNGLSSADALRAVKLRFLKEPRACHPAYWASFVLNGNGASRLPYRISWTLLLGPLGILAALVVFLRTRVKRE